MITTSDSLQYIKSKGDYEFNIIYADPPYALGSEVYIRPDGKVDYSKASDFMSKWEMPTGEYWEAWFKEAFRTLKYGGYLILFGIDRQTLLFKYYALLSGFQEKQSLYWYFISNFPKATDLSKMIDKNAGAEREVIGTKKSEGGRSGNTSGIENLDREIDITTPSTDLAKKYDGYKYSIAPLKQTNETIMIFMKPTKTGSPLHDTLAYESGDSTINVSAIDIDGNKVGTSGGTKKAIENIKDSNDRKHHTDRGIYNDRLNGGKVVELNDGRYPAQTFIDNEASQVLDEQSGVSGGNYKPPTDRVRNNGIGLGTTELRNGMSEAPDNYGDIGGASKILHKVNYTKEDAILSGRYPAQTFIDSEASQVLDEQSGVSKSQSGGVYKKDIDHNTYNMGELQPMGYDDIGGASKILHKCNYEQDDLTLYHYEPKVGNGERNAGLGGFDTKNGGSYEFRQDGSLDGVIPSNKNNHPTLKPIDLNYRILKLFKTPDNQKILYPFAGSGSEIIGGIKAGFDNWVGCEINPDYVEIANARIKYWKETMWEQQSLFGEI